MYDQAERAPSQKHRPFMVYRRGNNADLEAYEQE
jgi:hypothetical protein